MRWELPLAVFCTLALLTNDAPAQGTCGWAAAVSEVGILGGSAEIPAIGAMVVFDDGTGPALHAGGSFTTDSATSANAVARWNGTAWAPLGSGIDGYVAALEVFDDGSGAALYAAGRFRAAGGSLARNVARWNGTTWSPVGAGLGSTATESVAALQVFDDGTGPALYAAGSFTSAGGAPALGIARWDGLSWSPLGAGLGGGQARALAVFDGGGGPTLHAGGTFTSAGGAPAPGLARWDGSAWTAFPSGVSGGLGSAVHALETFDDGAGPDLYVGGIFTMAGGISASGVARWNGASWSAVDGGVGSSGFAEGVWAMTGYDDGSGPVLCVAGSFNDAGAALAFNVASWDGTSWSALAGGLTGSSTNPVVGALAAFDDGSGPVLYAGGRFSLADGAPADRAAVWDGAGWTPLGGILAGSEASVHALLAAHDASGTALYAGGSFTVVDGVFANGVARFDGTTWTPLGLGFNGPVHALALFDDGGGTALYAGGSFTSADGALAVNVARWNGTHWTDVGIGVGAGPEPTGVRSLAVHDDGTGPALYVGGTFASAGGLPVNHLARWDGTAWSDVGGGVVWTGPVAATSVEAMTVFDDGTGPRLFVAGRFNVAGAVPASCIAAWDGSSWTPLGAGIVSNTPFLPPIVEALEVWNDGGGPALAAGGTFYAAGGVLCANVARWRGGAWSALGSGIGTASSSSVHALSVHDDGSGPALVAGGRFGTAGGTSAANVTLWDGGGWSALGAGTDDDVTALGVFDAGAGTDLLVGGTFTTAGAVVTPRLARWACGSTISLRLDQPGGPGTDVLAINGNLTPGREYFNLVSLTPCPGGPGSGPTLGLCIAPPALLFQATLPLARPLPVAPSADCPFHFVAPASHVLWGPWLPFLPPNPMDVVCVDVTGGRIGAVSAVTRFTVQ